VASVLPETGLARIERDGLVVIGDRTVNPGDGLVPFRPKDQAALVGVNAGAVIEDAGIFRIEPDLLMVVGNRAVTVAAIVLIVAVSEQCAAAVNNVWLAGPAHRGCDGL
jgi:hypothetical protein